MQRSTEIDWRRTWFGTRRLLPALAAVALVAGGLVLAAAAPGDDDSDDDSDDEAIPFSDARMIIEVNATDGDAGIQVFIDGEGWRKTIIEDPSGNRIFEVVGKGSVRKQGLTELFFESAEPSFDEQTLEELFELFPEGPYEFSGVTTDGFELEGVAIFTHAIPDAPFIVMPPEGGEVDPDNTVIVWAPVADPPGSVIAGYQVIVEQEVPHRVLQVTLPADATMLTVPPEFLEPDNEYKLEVLAIEAGGNQTITESSFITAP